MEAPGIEPSARRVENGRKRAQTDGNGRGSGDLNGKMRGFATAIRPDAAASVYQVYKRRIASWAKPAKALQTDESGRKRLQTDVAERVYQVYQADDQ